MVVTWLSRSLLGFIRWTPLNAMVATRNLLDGDLPLAHAGQPLPLVRLATVASQKCPLPHRQRHRCSALARRSLGPISSRSRLASNSEATRGNRSAKLLPDGACARDLARAAHAHSGQPVPFERAAGFASHSWKQAAHRQSTGRLLPRPRVATSISGRPTTWSASLKTSGKASRRRSRGTGPGMPTVLPRGPPQPPAGVHERWIRS